MAKKKERICGSRNFGTVSFTAITKTNDFVDIWNRARSWEPNAKTAA